jgi:hypothetical protein
MTNDKDKKMRKNKYTGTVLVQSRKMIKGKMVGVFQNNGKYQYECTS